ISAQRLAVLLQDGQLLLHAGGVIAHVAGIGILRHQLEGHALAIAANQQRNVRALHTGGQVETASAGRFPPDRFASCSPMLLSRSHSAFSRGIACGPAKNFIYLAQFASSYPYASQDALRCGVARLNRLMEEAIVAEVVMARRSHIDVAADDLL